MIDIKALKKPKCLTCCKEKDYGGDRFCDTCRPKYTEFERQVLMYLEEIQSIVESILIDSDKEE